MIGSEVIRAWHFCRVSIYSAESSFQGGDWSYGLNYDGIDSGCCGGIGAAVLLGHCNVPGWWLTWCQLDSSSPARLSFIMPSIGLALLGCGDVTLPQRSNADKNLLPGGSSALCAV